MSCCGWGHCGWGHKHIHKNIWCSHVYMSHCWVGGGDTSNTHVTHVTHVYINSVGWGWHNTVYYTHVHSVQYTHSYHDQCMVVNHTIHTLSATAYCSTESDAFMPKVSVLIASTEEPVSMLSVSEATLVEGTLRRLPRSMEYTAITGEEYCLRHTSSPTHSYMDW